MNDKTFETLRFLGEINQLRSITRGIVTENDLYRMIASVEEGNCNFEAFYMRDHPDRPNNFKDYPIYYSNEVREGEVWGGEWSLLNEEDNTTEYPCAFTRLTYIYF